MSSCIYHIHKTQTQKNKFFFIFGAALVHFVERSITIRKINNLWRILFGALDYNQPNNNNNSDDNNATNIRFTSIHTQAVDLSSNPLIWSRLFGKLVFDGKRKLVTYLRNRLHFIWQMFTKWYYQDVTQHGLQHVRKQVKVALVWVDEEDVKMTAQLNLYTYELIQQQFEINVAN